jgi:hypothetical protein
MKFSGIITIIVAAIVTNLITVDAVPVVGRHVLQVKDTNSSTTNQQQAIGANDSDLDFDDGDNLLTSNLTI